LSRDEWVNVVEMGRFQSPDYIQVDDRYYEVGQTAANHAPVPAEGVARYRRDYYGVLMCQVIADLFEPEEIQGAIVFASYPPGDRLHKDELEDALKGEWSFVHQGRQFEVVVRTVATYTEPQGGFWNFIIKEENGEHIDNREYNPKRQTLVVDFGGGTMSLLPIGQNQLPDFRRADSLPIGFINVARTFEREMKNNHRDLFRASRGLPTDLLHEALATGRFYGGGYDNGINVEAQVEVAMQELIEQFRAAYERAGGPMPFGQIVLTGGGSIVLGERIKALLNHRRVFYAHENIEELAFANVTGGLKACREMYTETEP
jgi:hypothetical protein